MHLLVPDQLNTYDVLVCDDVVFTRARSRRSWPGPARGKGAKAVAAPRRRGRSDGGERAVKIADPRDVLLAPVISEKSYGLLDENKYTFLVRPDANKTQIKIAVEQVFGVKVTGVNTLNRQGKRRRTRVGFGKRADTKRAIVSVADGERIDIFGGPVS